MAKDSQPHGHHSQKHSHKAHHQETRGSVYIHGALLKRDTHDRDNHFQDPWRTYEPPKAQASGVGSVKQKLSGFLSSVGSRRGPKKPKNKEATRAVQQALENAYDVLLTVADHSLREAEQHSVDAKEYLHGIDRRSVSLTKMVPMAQFLSFWQILAIHRYVQGVGPPPSDDVQAQVAEAFAALSEKLGKRADLGPGWQMSGDEEKKEPGAKFTSRRFQLRLKVPRALFDASLTDFINQHSEATVVNCLHEVTLNICREWSIKFPQKPLVDNVKEEDVQEEPDEMHSPRTARSLKSSGSGPVSPRSVMGDSTLPRFLQRGAYFTKYGRMGAPKPKFVLVSDTHIVWAPDQEWAEERRDRPSQANSIALDDIDEVVPGKGTKVFRRKVAADAPEACCFSIVTAKRTLDLQATSSDDAAKWAQAINDFVFAPAEDDEFSVSDSF